MASNMRRGTIPYKTTGLGDYVDEVYSLEGFFGDWAHLFRRNNPAHPLRWSDDRLMYSGLDPAALTASDADDPAGEPLRLLEGEGVAVSISRRAAAMPFCEKNVDSHQIRFYHRGRLTLRTELGSLAVEPGDFVVIPRGLTYRECPVAGGQAPLENAQAPLEGAQAPVEAGQAPLENAQAPLERPQAPLEATFGRNATESALASPGSAMSCVYIFEVQSPVRLAERLWDSVGYASLFVDDSEMELPEPAADGGDRSAGAAGDGEEHQVRVRYENAWHRMVYDFDPCGDVIGWVGDPVIFKMSVRNVPTSGTTHGHLPPPSGAVLFGEGREFFFNILSMPPPPTVPPPDGSFGAPAHLNDYDEVWLTHASEPAPHTEGHLWLLPRTIPHPGMKRPRAPMRDGRQPQSVRINFDTRASLRWTERAREALFEDPVTAKYTSFFGVPLKAAPEKVRRRAAAESASAEGGSKE